MAYSIPKSFSLEKLTKKLYGKPAAVPLLSDFSLPQLMKDDINEFYSSCKNEGESFDKNIKAHKGLFQADSIKHLRVWHLGANLFCFSLDQANRYKDLMKKKLGSDIETKIKSIIEKEYYHEEITDCRRLLLKLVAFDPRWLYQGWVKKEIKKAVDEDDFNFFFRLGTFLSNKSKKYNKPHSYKETGKKVIEYLESLSNIYEPVLVPPSKDSISFLRKYVGHWSIKNVNDVAKLLVREGVGNYYNRKTLRTLLKRHHFYLDSELKITGYLKQIETEKKRFEKEVEYLQSLLSVVRKNAIRDTILNFVMSPIKQGKFKLEPAFC